MPLTEEQRKRLKDEAAKELGYLVMSGVYELVERLETDPDSGELVPKRPAAIAVPAITDETENVDGLVTAAIKIAQQRTARLLELRRALQKNDAQRVRQLAERLTGLREDSDEERNPASPRVN